MHDVLGQSVVAGNAPGNTEQSCAFLGIQGNQRLPFTAGAGEQAGFVVKQWLR